MHYYVLPGTGIYGGVKKGFHCADLLSASGYPCPVALPEVERPTWFPTNAELLSQADLVRICTPDDTILFSCPADAPYVDGLPAGRKVLHMQGASTPADGEMLEAARGYELISHGLHMTYEVQRRGRVAPYVPLGVPEVFRAGGDLIVPGRVAVMPRKGSDVLDRIRDALPEGAELILIDGLSEAEVAARLQSVDVFLAISPEEAFGLPPLEAMCAGCCVVGFPGVGGFEFLRHRETAHVVPNGDVPALIEGLRFVLRETAYREALRSKGQAFSAYYTLDREREYLLRALGFDSHGANRATAGSS